MDFKALHYRDTPLLMPNAWDPGSARMLAAMRFEAIATSSGASSAVLGRKDGQLTRAEAIAHGRSLVENVDIPVSADLENGFGRTPEEVAQTVREAIAAGLSGCSIEDASSDPDHPIFDFTLAVERITAAVEVVRSSGKPFMLTGRTENFLRGRLDLDDSIRRLQAYERAGADVLFAPGLPDIAAVRSVCSAVGKPVNFMVGIRDKSFSVAELTQAGVKRISLAGSLYRVAMKAAAEAAREARDQGTFGFLERM